jgi:hypothetical protein
MQTQSPTLPRIAIQSIAGGLLLMALFTIMWAGIAQAGLQGKDDHIVLILFAILSAGFVIYGIKLFITAKKIPKFTNDADKAEGKEMAKWFGIIFGIEGTLIPLSSVALQLSGHPQFILPTIALIVGLHFYPMAKVFNRTIDYYLATYTCLVAIAAIYMISNNTIPQILVFTFMGIGVALTTSTYGVYMLFAGYKLTAGVERRVQ